MTNQTLIISASVLGHTAFKKGIKSVPCLDPKLMDLISGLKNGASIPVMKAWSKAWHLANLNNPS